MSYAYPKAFLYYLSRLSNFSRNKIRLQTLANTQFGPNQQLVVELPQGLIDLETFTLHGLVRATTAGANLVPIELLIDSLSIEIGGISLMQGLTNYGDLYNVFRQYQMEDKKNFRKVLQLEGRSDNAPGSASDPVVLAPESALPFAIYSWLGFLSDVKVIDTTIIPPVKIYIRLAPGSVLTKHADAPASSYELREVFASCDIMDIADGVYHGLQQRRLAEGALEIPFTNYQTVLGSLGQVTSSTRWSTSTDCLEGIIATVKHATPNSGVHNNTTKLSSYFTRGTNGAGTVITNAQFKVNGIPMPSQPAESKYGEIFCHSAMSLGAAQDVLGATDVGMVSHEAWLQNYFVHAITFGYPDAEDAHRLVGLSGKNGQLLGSWDISGSGNQLQPILWLKCKSVLQIGSNKYIQVIL